MKHILTLLTFNLLLFSCDSAQQSQSVKALMVNASQDDQWRELWYDGNAEVNVYETSQARYQDVHPGSTVLIFVTEDFLTDKQVKNETSESKASTSVLKTNLVRKFDTGVYDYSIMTSVFTPVDQKVFPHSLKITTTSQDWCGHSFMQLNHERNKYRVHQFSYFQKEGDEEFSVDGLFTEDEIFNQIRLNPDLLPSGDQKMLPGTVFTRLKHISFKPYPVKIEKGIYSGSEFYGNNLASYQILFPDFDRTLEIIYENNFPYHIAGWKDTYAIMSGQKMSSTFKKVSSKRMPYWSKHNLEDSHLRTELGL